MPSITISRQLGSLGDEVAQAIAERLNYQVVCRDLINQAAIRCGAPEMALFMIDDLDLLGLRPTRKSRQHFLTSMSEVMHELAAQGDYVIVGRAGQMILKDYPGVLHVKVIAPARLRIERIATEQSISLEAAQAQVLGSDRSRRNYLIRYYHVRWDDPELYDLIVNTSRLAPADAACLICQAMKQCIFQTMQNSRSTILQTTNGF
jgi:cytidylate kinase